MSDRLTVDTITSDQLDALYDQLEAAEQTESQRQLATAREALASASLRAARMGHAVKQAAELAVRLEDAERERDGAYRERAHLLAWLAALHPASAVIAPAPDVDEDGWDILYLVAGGRQMTWHIAPRDRDLFGRIPHVPADDPRAQWDGHTTDEKYQHIREHSRLLAMRAADQREGTPGCGCTYGQRCPNCRD